MAAVSVRSGGIAMRRSWSGVIAVAAMVLVGSVVVRSDQGGRGGRGGGQAGGPGPAIPQVSRTPPVDAALSAAGKALWTEHCITCHGTNARGTDSGPNLVRSETVNYDRATPKAPGTGQVLGPYLRKGHQTQSGKPSSQFTDAEITQLAQFLSERVNETMRGSPTYVVLNENVLTGDPKAGETYFKGAGGCTKCHTDQQRSLAGIGSRYTTAQQLQARVLYPGPAGGGRGGRGRGRGAAPSVSTAGAEVPKPDPLAPVTTITRPGQKPINVWTVQEDAFFLTYRDAEGITQTIRKTPDVNITVTNPMQWHLDFADRLEDDVMHDLTAYLWSLK
jgi:mono/diheme cytochrome c family protein